MLDPEIWRISSHARRDISVALYNHLVRSAPINQQVLATNPGAAILALRRIRTSSPQVGHLNHPGQLITAARAELEDCEVPRRYWKTVAATPSDAMLVLTRPDVTRRIRGMVLAACGELQIRPTPRAAQILIDLMSSQRAYAHPSFRSQRGARPRPSYRPVSDISHASNLALARIILNESDTLPEDWLIAAMAHAHRLADRGQPVRSRTTKGMTKNIKRSERQQRNERSTPYQTAAPRPGAMSLRPDTLSFPPFRPLIETFVTPGLHPALSAAPILRPEDMSPTLLARYRDELHKSPDQPEYDIRNFALSTPHHNAGVLTLRRNGKTWTIHRLLGISGFDVDRYLMQAAQVVRARYQAAWDIQRFERQPTPTAQHSRAEKPAPDDRRLAHIRANAHQALDKIIDNQDWDFLHILDQAANPKPDPTYFQSSPFLYPKTSPFFPDPHDAPAQSIWDFVAPRETETISEEDQYQSSDTEQDYDAEYDDDDHDYEWESDDQPERTPRLLHRITHFFQRRNFPPD